MLPDESTSGEPQERLTGKPASIDGPPSLNALVIRNDAELVSAATAITVWIAAARAISVWITAWAITV